MVFDIGDALFRGFLQMNMYPGAPFTGVIVTDIVQFLLVPSVFIFMVLYTATGRIFPERNLRIILGITAYLFLVTGGYYSIFALVAGPYFLYLIFVLGLLFLLRDHFTGGGGYGRGGGGYSGGSFDQSGHYHGKEPNVNKIRQMLRMGHSLNPAEISYLEDQLDVVVRKKEAIKDALKMPGSKVDAKILTELEQEQAEIEIKLGRYRRR